MLATAIVETWRTCRVADSIIERMPLKRPPNVFRVCSILTRAGPFRDALEGMKFEKKQACLKDRERAVLGRQLQALECDRILRITTTTSAIAPAAKEEPAAIGTDDDPTRLSDSRRDGQRRAPAGTRRRPDGKKTPGPWLRRSPSQGTSRTQPRSGEMTLVRVGSALSLREAVCGARPSVRNGASHGVAHGGPTAVNTEPFRSGRFARPCPRFHARGCAADQVSDDRLN